MASRLRLCQIPAADRAEPPPPLASEPRKHAKYNGRAHTPGRSSRCAARPLEWNPMTWGGANGQAAGGQRRPAEGRLLAGQERAHRGVEAARHRTPDGARAQHRRRRPGDLAGHGGEYRAVLVYQIDSYRHWQERLGRDDFVYGQFGENFTVDGLPDDEVCVGDRYRIGEAVFEVTQPRVTCYRVGLRMDEPRMPSLLVSHRRPGFYLRVLTEGRVEAGEEIVKVGSGPEGMTVAEIDALLYLPGHPRDQLARALRIPALSPGWKGSLRALLDQADGVPGKPAGNAGLAPASAGPPPAWDGFRPLRVARVDAESTSVFSLTLAAVDGRPLPEALPGQFLTLRLRPDTAAPRSSAVTRCPVLRGPRAIASV
ncbi:MOSC domain-containing protein [Streptosporangium lutulentum]